MDNPLHHFELHAIIPLTLFGMDISITQAVVMMWIVVAGVVGFFWFAGLGRQLVPTKIQSLAEMSIEMIRGLILDNMGEKGLRYFPFLISLFFFILFANLFGLVPGSYTFTSQLFVTGLFAIIIYGTSLIVGFSIHGLHFLTIFVPSGTPKPLLIFMVPLEIFSHALRPVTLSVRLFANMTAGHTILIVLFSLMILAGSSDMFGATLVAALPFLMSIAVYILETFVAFIQAFIFTILATVYIGDAIKLH